VRAYVSAAAKKSDIDRTNADKEKTGVKLEGVTAVNPINGEEVPVFVADYVLAGYGTGAVMAVPAHDERDFAFAKRYGLSVKHVVAPETGDKNDNEEIRASIVAVVEDPNTGKVLKVRWGKEFGDRRLFVGGGIEKGEDIEAAARREVREETGYKNLRLKGFSGPIFHHYYSKAKNKHRMTESVGVFFELVDYERDPQALDEHEKDKFTVEWTTKEDSKNDQIDAQHYFLDRYFLGGEAFTGHGILVGSGKFDGMDSDAAMRPITEAAGGRWVKKFKLRDWVFSRQRYWGEPIPMISCEKCGWVPVPEKDLPVTLPAVEKYEPTDTGESPLAAITEWVNVKCPKCGGPAHRETDTMPNWAGSSWYYLRYVDPKNSKALADKKKLEYWTPVDWYNGGMEHTTLHLLYSRFWHKFLYDIGVVPTVEPYKKRTSHGMILAEGGEKMSKSRGNVVNPDELIENYGADTLRVYEMFMGPFDQAIAWDTKSMIGPRRFIERVYALAEKVAETGATTDASLTPDTEILLNKTIKKVSEDIEGTGFNTAISALMILANGLEREPAIPRGAFEAFIKLLAPFAPHVADELWRDLGNESSIHRSAWPVADESKAEHGDATIVVQVNGKVRASFKASKSASKDDLERTALSMDEVKKWIGSKPPKKVIVVPGKLVSVVVNP
ncbi:MAG: class I tRNA ligase family protein, partial [Patescibacteria group bacterium]|nr:class I tRNA ligase family protein [Patescibacteria group bacterium]